MGRVESREEVFKLVFEYIINKEKNEILLEEVLENKKVDASFVSKIYNLVVENYETLVKEIDAAAHGYKVGRMFKVDLALIIMALAEIKYIDGIPAAVSINEALNLAKKYSTDKSASFINGVLSSFVK